MRPRNERRRHDEPIGRRLSYRSSSPPLLVPDGARPCFAHEPSGVRFVSIRRTLPTAPSCASQPWVTLGVTCSGLPLEATASSLSVTLYAGAACRFLEWSPVAMHSCVHSVKKCERSSGVKYCRCKHEGCVAWVVREERCNSVSPEADDRGGGWCMDPCGASFP